MDEVTEYYAKMARAEARAEWAVRAGIAVLVFGALWLNWPLRWPHEHHSYPIMEDRAAGGHGYLNRESAKKIWHAAGLRPPGWLFDP
jgi:hypothetical protein